MFEVLDPNEFGLYRPTAVFERLRDFCRAERVEIVHMGIGTIGLRIIDPLRVPAPSAMWRHIDFDRPPGVLCRGYMFVHTTPVEQHV